MRKPSRDPAIESDIARRAHELWEKEGRPHGRDHEHWTQAESQVLSGLADHTIPGENAAPDASVTSDQEPASAPAKKPAKPRARKAVVKGSAATKSE